MAWPDQLIPLVRDMVADTGATPKYTDDDLEGLLVTAATFVARAAEFLNDYTVDRDNGTVEPDPTESPTLDPDFVVLWTERAACILTQGQLIKTAGQAIRIVDGRSEIDLRDAFRARLAMTEKTWCAQYERDLLDYKKKVAQNGGVPPGGDGGGVGRQVTTPVRYY